MKKYKHKKTGEIATYKDGILKSAGFCVEIGVEPSSEFWEEVVEKDYEILSFIDISKLIKKEDGLFYRENTQNNGVREDQISHFRINSVLRKSDNCVFSIGDEVKQSNVIHNNTFVIKAFELDVNNNHLLAISNGGIKISKIEKSKPVLFKSFDGVDIYESDGIFIVNKFFSLGFSKGVSYNNHKDNKFFSTQEAAQEYILMNKPCLSINDVTKNLEAFKNNKFILNELKELVKSKL